jgi:hypothetical protein
VGLEWEAKGQKWLSGQSVEVACRKKEQRGKAGEGRWPRTESKRSRFLIYAGDRTLIGCE